MFAFFGYFILFYIFGEKHVRNVGINVGFEP